MISLQTGWRKNRSNKRARGKGKWGLCQILILAEEKSDGGVALAHCLYYGASLRGAHTKDVRAFPKGGHPEMKELRCKWRRGISIPSYQLALCQNEDSCRPSLCLGDRRIAETRPRSGILYPKFSRSITADGGSNCPTAKLLWWYSPSPTLDCLNTCEMLLKRLIKALIWIWAAAYFKADLGFAFWPKLIRVSI